MSDKIKGPELSQKKIDLINNIKNIEKDLIEFVSTIKNSEASEDLSYDPRWLSIGITDLEKGFMGIVKSISMNSSAITKEGSS